MSPLRSTARRLNLCGLSVGVGSGLLADVLISRRRPGLDPSEAWTVLSACVIAAVLVGCPERSARSLLGVGWMCHALFDLALAADDVVANLGGCCSTAVALAGTPW